MITVVQVPKKARNALTAEKTAGAFFRFTLFGKKIQFFPKILYS
jgi:hypothetical protein